MAGVSFGGVGLEGLVIGEERMMRFSGPAQAIDSIELISSLSKHHRDPSCPIIHGNGIITARHVGPGR